MSDEKGRLGRMASSVATDLKKGRGTAENKEARRARVEAQKRDQQAAAEANATAARTAAKAAGQTHEYKVEQIRQTLMGDKIKTDGVEKLLNERAAQGWRLRSIVETAVEGRIGVGGTGGLVVVFEREL